MCEIAVIDPEQCSISATHQIAAKFDDEQGDGLGVLAVFNNGDTFDFNTYKSTDPHWQTLYTFLRRNWNDAWRVVVHGRAATAGDVNRDNSHPLHVDCQHCEFDWVVHNGSVRTHRKIRSGLISQGHTFETAVDSEVLAHKVSELPETVEEHDRNTYDFRGNLNYLLFSEDGILVRVSSKYHLTDEFTMTCSIDEFGDADLGFESGNDTEWMLIEPGEGEPEIEMQERTVWQSNTSSSSRTNRRNASARQSHYNGMWGAIESGEANRSGSSASNDGHVVEYTDRCNYNKVTVIQVAPGVLRVINDDTHDDMYIYRGNDPRLYYFYSDEQPPADIDELERLADAGRLPTKDTAQYVKKRDLPDAGEDDDRGNINDAVVMAATSAVKNTLDDVTIGEAAEVQDEIRDAIAATTGE